MIFFIYISLYIIDIFQREMKIALVLELRSFTVISFDCRLIIVKCGHEDNVDVANSV